MTKFLLAAAGLALSTNAALALDCRAFFTDTDVQHSCFKFVGSIGESREGVRTTCEILKLANLTSAQKKDLEACLREFPDPPAPTRPTPYERGLNAFGEGDFDVAIAEFTTAISDDPKDTFSYIKRGSAFEKKGDTASAIADYRKVKLVDHDIGAEYAAKIRKLEKTKK